MFAVKSFSVVVVVVFSIFFLLLKLCKKVIMATCCFYSFNDKFLHEIKYVQSLKVMST